MKRYILLFCVLVFVFALMVVPAFATQAITFTPAQIDGILVSSFPPGAYTLNVYRDGVVFWSYPEFVVDSVNGVNIYDADGSPDGTPFILEISYVEQGVSIFIGACNDTAEECGNFSDMWIVDFYEFVPAGIVPEPVSPISGILGVFTGLGSWLTAELGGLASIFWNGQGLTFIGMLSVCALAVAVVLLISYMLLRFIRFKG